MLIDAVDVPAGWTLIIRPTLIWAVGRDRFYRFLERTWMLQQLPIAGALYLLGGWSFVTWGVCARVTASVTGHWFVGHLAHRLIRRPGS